MTLTGKQIGMSVAIIALIGATLCATLCACRSARVVNYPVEGPRVSAYYRGKINADPFQPAFYDRCDSVFSDSTNGKQWQIRLNIQSERQADSLGSRSAKYYELFLQIVEEQIKEK